MQENILEERIFERDIVVMLFMLYHTIHTMVGMVFVVMENMANFPLKIASFASTLTITYLFFSLNSQGSHVSECFSCWVRVKHWPLPHRWLVSFLTKRWAQTITCLPEKKYGQHWVPFPGSWDGWEALTFSIISSLQQKRSWNTCALIYCQIPFDSLCPTTTI